MCKVIFFFSPSAANTCLLLLYRCQTEEDKEPARLLRLHSRSIARHIFNRRLGSLCRRGEAGRAPPPPPELGPHSGLISSFELGWRKASTSENGPAIHNSTCDTAASSAGHQPVPAALICRMNREASLHFLGLLTCLGDP